jgi:anti-sigma factor RsiW
VRCRKAHWYLSAQCDDTLSEKQRRDLAAHLEECPSCRREAFYFSEIKGQTARIDKVRARADFNLRLQARINTWEAEQEKLEQTRPSIWKVVHGLPARVTEYLTDLGGVLIGQRRFAVVGIVTAVLAVVIWTGYDADNGTIESNLALTQNLPGLVVDGYYSDALTGPADAAQGYLVSGISLVDETSLRRPPNYVMPTVPAEQVNAQLIF